MTLQTRGEIASDYSVDIEVAELTIHNSNQHNFDLTANGTISPGDSGGLSGTLYVFQHSEIRQSLDMTLDFSTKDVAMTGTSSNFVEMKDELIRSCPFCERSIERLVCDRIAFRLRREEHPL